MKKRTKIILFSALTLTFFGAGFFILKGSFWDRPARSQVSYSKQTASAGVVEVEAIPKELTPGRKMVFTLYLNNHSIDLNYELTKLAVVVDDTGRIYKPVNWTGESGGHHLSGDLEFDKLSGKAKHIGLNLTGINNQKVVFDWEL